MTSNLEVRSLTNTQVTRDGTLTQITGVVASASDAYALGVAGHVAAEIGKGQAVAGAFYQKEVQNVLNTIVVPSLSVDKQERLASPEK